MFDWGDRRVLITGGASFIGSHLTDALVGLGAKIRVVDNLSSGRLANLQQHLSNGAIEFIEADLLESNRAHDAVQGMGYVFHLAADHGGRGYVDRHQAGPASNLILDGLLFRAAYQAGIEKIIFASSGCVYPKAVQSDPDQEVYLKEDLVKPPYDADNLYGWAKLMAELTLQEYCKEHKMKIAICRYFTAYGPRGHENLAVMALIAKAFIGQQPFEVWGDGRQVRNWTYIDDIVQGTLLAAEKIDDGTPVNIGTMERITVKDAAKMILNYTGHDSTSIQWLRDMPTGPLNRVADNSRARMLLGWQPKVSFSQGVKQTIDWYLATKDRDQIQQTLDYLLMER
jgi:nucleoside-diphosphate-sugar epimerase